VTNKLYVLVNVGIMKVSTHFEFRKCKELDTIQLLNGTVVTLEDNIDRFLAYCVHEWLHAWPLAYRQGSLSLDIAVLALPRVPRSDPQVSLFECRS
jgi:hypothetical protein